MTGFWRWLARGASGGKSGLRQAFVDWKIPVIHAPVAGLLTWFTATREEAEKISDIAASLMLPLAGALIGLCFAWSGHAAALMQTREIEDVIDRRGKGVEDYVFGYQFAILTMLAVLVAWGLGSLGVFDMLKGGGDYAARAALFFLASFGVNQCWSAAVFTSAMLQVRHQLRLRAAKKEKDESASREITSPEVKTA